MGKKNQVLNKFLFFFSILKSVGVSDAEYIVT